MYEDVPEDEARYLLSQPSRCDDIDWAPSARPLRGHVASTGLVDLLGSSRGMYVQLHVAASPKTKIVVYKFTVFKLESRSPRRVYQLDIEKYPKLPVHKHDYPHEHVWQTRYDGTAAWLGWSYTDALTHFKTRTNIQFEPEDPSDPDEFRLKG